MESFCCFFNFVFQHPKVFSDSRCMICVCVDLCLYQLLSGPCGHDVDPEIQKSIDFLWLFSESANGQR